MTDRSPRELADRLAAFGRELTLSELPGSTFRLFERDGGAIAVGECEGALAEALGLTTATIGGAAVEELFGPEGEAAAAAVFGRVAAGETINCRVDAGDRAYIVALFPIPAAIGRREIAGAATDVTELREAAEALRKSEERFRIISSLTTDYVFKLDIDPAGGASMSFVTDSFRTATGREMEEARTPDLWGDVIHSEDLPALRELLGRLVAQGGTAEFEGRSFVKSGAERRVHVVAEALRDGEGARTTAIVGAVKDVTDKRRAEEEHRRLEAQLHHAQRMESVGRLAGGVAHDFNNLLTSITGNVELALLDLSPADPLVETLREVQRNAESAAALTRQLLAFSRRQIIDPKVLNFNGLIENLNRMLERIIGEDITLDLVLEADLGQARVDPGQVEQILVNLVVNSRDAMPEGGRLTIETANVELDATYCEHHVGVHPGEYVMLAVSDTGVGMTDEVKRHLFEPFFTTKPKGRGTGLGLATIYGAIQQNGGHVAVYSEAGHGSTFRIYFPRVRESAEVIPTQTAAAELPGGSEVVFVVEDELLVRDLACRILRRLGYKVSSFANAGEALLAAREHDGPIDLLVTDIVMPGMNGRALAEELRAHRPDLRVLLTSGYTETVAVRGASIGGTVAFLAKPYSPGALAQKVRDVLDGKGRLSGR